MPVHFPHRLKHRPPCCRPLTWTGITTYSLAVITERRHKINSSARIWAILSALQVTVDFQFLPIIVSFAVPRRVARSALTFIYVYRTGGICVTWTSVIATIRKAGSCRSYTVLSSRAPSAPPFLRVPNGYYQQKCHECDADHLYICFHFFLPSPSLFDVCLLQPKRRRPLQSTRVSTTF